VTCWYYSTHRDGAIATKNVIVDAGGTCSGILPCDFRSLAAIVQIFERIDEIWKDGIDVLRNNAGIVTKNGVRR